MKKILIVDDDTAVTNYFLVFLAQTERFDSTIVNDSRQVAGLLARERFDAILLDMDMPEVSGMDILKLLREQGIPTPVVVLTGVGGVDLAVKSMKLGAFDYLTKPVDENHLLEVLDQALEHGALRRTLRELPSELKREDLAHGAAFEGFVTQDPRLIRLLHEADKMASGDMPVFIIGERGAGREKLARAIHDASPRRNGPFSSLDAGGLEPREELPAKLFGRARIWGDLTEERPGLFEETAGGSLFIDNIEHLSVPVQLRLKRAIQAREFYRESSTKVLTADLRLIVGSTRDLALPKSTAGFSRDFLYHLVVNTLRIPPLRERPGDIPLLAERALRLETARTGKAIRSISPEALDLLRRYRFPENEEELTAIVAGAVNREETDALGPEALPAHVREQPPPAEGRAAEDFEPRKLIEVERDHILRTLRHCSGDRRKAAAELGIPVEQVDEILADRPLRGKKRRPRKRGRRA